MALSNVLQQGLGRRSEQVLVALREELQSGVYPCNARLPTEGELCERFSASRNTIRRAIARLEAEGWVEVRQGAGTFVRRAGEEPTASRTISVMFPFDGETLQRTQQAALDRGCLLCVYTHGDWSAERERVFLERVLEERHRALLAFCTPHAPRNEDLLRELVDAGVRVLHVEHYRTALPDQGYILPDYRRGGYVATSALMIAGYEHLRFLSVEGDGPYVDLTAEGMMTAMADLRGDDTADFAQRTRIVVPRGIDNQPELRSQFDALLDGLPDNTGLLVRSLGLAETLATELRQRGRRVPEDIGVIGVNHLLNNRPPGNIDEIDYDWHGALSRAVDLVLAPAWREVRELTPPRLIRTGTIRAKA